MKLDRRVALVGLAASATAPAFAWGVPRSSRWAAIEDKAQAMINDRLAPGLQICVTRRGSVVFSRAFGQANLETNTSMTPASDCRIGSITKQFTAAGILLLVQDGKLALDDSLGRFLPDFPHAERLSLRRMLNHTSGLGDYTETKPPDLFLQESRPDRTTAQLVDVMRKSSGTLIFEPGEKWGYSNTAYVLLGVVIEKVTGRPWAEFLTTRLFKPLGLTHTAIDDAAEVVLGRATGYSNDPKAPSGFDNASFVSMTYPGGAGAICSTAEDLCAWHAGLLGGRVLRPAMLAAMLTPAKLNDGSLPTMPGDRLTPLRYGLGVVLEPIGGRAAVSHNGGIQGFTSYLSTLLEEQLTVATIINTDGGAESPPALESAPGELRNAIRAAALAA